MTSYRQQLVRFDAHEFVILSKIRLVLHLNVPAVVLTLANVLGSVIIITVVQHYFSTSFNHRSFFADCLST